MIISNKSCTAICIRADDTNSIYFCFINRKNSIILQKYAALSCHLKSFINVLFALYHTIRYLIIFTSVKQAQQISGCQQSYCGFCNFLFCYQSILISSHHMKIGISTVQVTACI